MVSRKHFIVTAAVVLAFNSFLLEGQPRPTMEKVFKISPSTASFSPEGGTIVFAVTSSEKWMISSGTQSWGHLTTVGNRLSLLVDPNTEASTRQDSFTLSSGNRTIRVSISQEGQPTLSVSSEKLSFGSSAGSKIINITTNRDWEIGTNTTSWGHLTKNGDQLNVRVDSNTGSSSRSGWFTVKSGNLEKRVDISQAASAVSSLSVSTDRLTFSATGGSQSITITSSEAWSIGTSTASWGHLSQNGNKLTVKVDPNSGVAKRTDWFTIKAGGNEKRVSIEQRPSSTSASTSSTKSSSASLTSSNKSTINSVTVVNNANVDGLKGLGVRVSFKVVGMINRDVAISCYFYDSDGNALVDTNDKYCTVDNPPHVAASKSFKPTSNDASYTNYEIAIPYEELHLNGTSSRTLKVDVLIWDKSVSPRKQVVRKDGTTFTCNPVISYLKLDGTTTNQTKSFSYSGGRQYYSIDTNADDYELWGVPSWCYVESKTSKGFVLVCSENSLSSSRDDFMVVKAAGKDIRISITQSGKPSTSYNSRSTTSNSGSSSSSGLGRRPRTYHDPWLRVGIDGSMDVIPGKKNQANNDYYDPYYDLYSTYSDSDKETLHFGVGFRARIGRPDHVFNLISGVRYMLGDESGIQLPVLLNWNMFRGEDAALYIGGGYEFGITDAYAGSHSSIIQVGISGTNADLQIYYKPEKDIIGLGLSLFF